MAEQHNSLLQRRIALLEGRLEELTEQIPPGVRPQQAIVRHLLERPDFVVVSNSYKLPAWYEMRDELELSLRDWQNATKNLCYEARVMRTHREPGRKAAQGISFDFTRLAVIHHRPRMYLSSSIVELAKHKAGEAAASGHLNVLRPDITERFTSLKPDGLNPENLRFGVTTEALRFLGMQALIPEAA